MHSLKKVYFGILLSCLTFLPVAASAIDVGTQLQATAGESGAGYAAARDPRLIIASGIKVFLSFLAIIFLVYTVYAGFLIMTARGEEDKVAEGKKTLVRGVIGIAVILSAYSITLLAAKLATGDAAHQGNYVEIKNTNVDFSNPDQRHKVNSPCQFGWQRGADGNCYKP